jgi:hypothetical protein
MPLSVASRAKQIPALAMEGGLACGEAEMMFPKYLSVFSVVLGISVVSFPELREAT